jgi:glycogen synthase
MDDLIFAINRANKAFENKIKWMEIQKNGMQRDWSWKKSALKWVNLYNKNLGND